jgi:hypothetical protein
MKPPIPPIAESGSGAEGAELQTYQNLLDESLRQTFPASDPVSASAAARCADPVRTGSNEADWQLEPGSVATPGSHDDKV